MPYRLMGPCCTKLQERNGNSRNSASQVNNFAFIVNNRWKLLREVGKGGYGKVYSVIDVNQTEQNNFYAMKIEKVRQGKHGRLPQEALVLETMISFGITRHIVNIFDKGMIDDPLMNRPAQFMVMTLLGPSLADLRKLFPGRKFSAVTVALLGIQGIESLQDLHLIGYVHRDVKPHNFMIGAYSYKRILYLIDFGMARKIIDENGRLLKIRTNTKCIPFRGTLKYCALGVHEHEEYGRHHDLWSLFHTLIELRDGRLPWSVFDDNRKATLQAKKRIIAQRWLKNVEKEYLTFYESLTSLHYDIKPDYNRLTKLLTSILKRANRHLNSALDWEFGGELYDKIIKPDRLKKYFHVDLMQQTQAGQVDSSVLSSI